MVTPDGTLVVATPNEREWERITTIKSLAEDAASIPLEMIPQELGCYATEDTPHLLENAVKMPCCGAHFCDECLRKMFIESTVAATGDSTISCPKCHRTGISQDSVVPDEQIRLKVNDFIEAHNKFALSAAEKSVEENGEIPDEGEVTSENDKSNKDSFEEPKKRINFPPLPFFPPPLPFMFPPPPSGIFPFGQPGIGRPPLPLPFPFPLPPNNTTEAPPTSKPTRSRSRSPSPPASRRQRTDPPQNYHTNPQ